MSGPPADATSGTAALATQSGVSGTQHVADCVSFSTDTVGAATANPYYVELLDGSTVVMQWYAGAPSYTSGASSVNVCGLNVVGTAGNGMTLRFGVGATNVSQAVNLIGHDAT